MAQEYTVTKAFQATVSKEDKTPKSFQSHGNTLYVWKVQLAGVAGWINVNKQEGNEVKEGDTLYGDVVPNQWNTGFDFKGAQRPLDGSQPQSAPVAQSAPQTPQTAPTHPTEGVTQDDKLDYIIGMLEDLRDLRNDAVKAFPEAPTEPSTDLDDLDI